MHLNVPGKMIFTSVDVSDVRSMHDVEESGAGVAACHQPMAVQNSVGAVEEDKEKGREHEGRQWLSRTVTLSSFRAAKALLRSGQVKLLSSL
jgi:hypothetical protein